MLVACIQIDNVLPVHEGLNFRFSVVSMFAPLLVTDTRKDAGPFSEQWPLDGEVVQLLPT